MRRCNPISPTETAEYTVLTTRLVCVEMCVVVLQQPGVICVLQLFFNERLKINQHIGPAAFKWLQGFNKLKDKLFIRDKVTVRNTQINFIRTSLLALML